MRPLAEVKDSMESMKHLEYLYHMAVSTDNDNDRVQIEAASDSDGEQVLCYSLMNSKTSVK